jgi:hypothetical protein
LFKKDNTQFKIPATRITVSTVGILCGVSGMEHGFFETLQGNVPPSTLLIHAIGPGQRFWPGGTETALTVVPSFLVTGLLAMLAGLLVIIWSAGFVQRKYGSLGFFLLSLFQFLVGGGFAQIFLVLLNTLAATQINRPWKGWRRLPRFFGKAWLPLLVVFALTLLASMFAAVFGFIPLVSSLFPMTSEELTGLLYTLGYSMLGLLPLTILAGLAHDVERK